MRDMIPVENNTPRWRRLVIEAALLFGFWLLLSGHYDLFHILLGVFSVLLVLAINRVSPRVDREKYFPLKFGRFLLYLPWLGREMIKSSLHVARVVLTPRMPLDPVMVRFKSRQPNDYARVILANSITLTPGTLTVELSEDEYLVHALTNNTAQGLVEGTMQIKVARLFTDQPEQMVSDVTSSSEIQK